MEHTTPVYYRLAQMTVPLLLERLRFVLFGRLSSGERYAWEMEAHPTAPWWASVGVDTRVKGHESPFASLYIEQTELASVIVILQRTFDYAVYTPRPDPYAAHVETLAAWLAAIAEEQDLTRKEQWELAMVRGWPAAEAARMDLRTYAEDVVGVSERTLQGWAKKYEDHHFITGWTRKRGPKK